MQKVKVAIIGCGCMGSSHFNTLETLEEFQITAICDINEEKKKLCENKNITFYNDYHDLIKNADIDAIIIATPHYLHPIIALEAMANNKHVLVEKPIGVHKKLVSEFVKKVKEYPNLKIAAMFNQRAIELHQKIKNMLDNGELGKITRINWIITDWFRTQFYYDSGDWRASWRGEGGGALINQCPHQLDLMQWFFGMPQEVHAFVEFGKYHDIEVEDEVTAFLKYKNGATGVFITTTGEAPGTNRLEIAGENGKLVLENSKLMFIRNEYSSLKTIKESTSRFGIPETWNCEINWTKSNLRGHKKILKNFGQAILGNEELIAHDEEGICSL